MFVWSCKHLSDLLVKYHRYFCTCAYFVIYYHLLSSSQFLNFASWHPDIFTPSHLPSSHLLKCTFDHLHIFTSSQLHILTSSSHLCTSAHLRISLSSHLLSFLFTVLPFCSLAVLVQAIRRCVESEGQAVDVESLRAHMVTFTTDGVAYYTASCYTKCSPRWLSPQKALLSFVSSITWDIFILYMNILDI
jgi:hypothetical protein